MKLLYVVAESDYDAYFYALCAELFTGHRYEPVVIKSRKRTGTSAVQNLMLGNLRKARGQASAGADVSFIAGIDNDRSPHAENDAMDRGRLSEAERTRPSRRDWMLEVVEKTLGADRKAWPLPVALAVPVEMIESWIVRAVRADDFQPARYFSRQDSQRARQFYEPLSPPPQWKDLADELQENSGLKNKRDFYFHIAVTMDAAAVAQRSLSFQDFKETLDGWPKPGN